MSPSHGELVDGRLNGSRAPWALAPEKAGRDREVNNDDVYTVSRSDVALLLFDQRDRPCGRATSWRSGRR